MSSTEVSSLQRDGARSRYQHVDALRAFAVMLVVISHSGLGGLVPGGSGVTIFFSISGFVITSLLLRERAQTGAFNARRFYLRRILKIAPPFVLIIMLPTWAYAISHHQVNYPHFASQIFFSYNWLLAFGAPDYLTLPGSAVVWSLAIEEQFYIVFACFWLFAARRKSYLRLLTIGATLAVIGSNALRAALTAQGAAVFQDRIYYGSDTRADGLALGILTAVLTITWRDHLDRFQKLRRWAGSDLTLLMAVVLFLLSLIIRDPEFRSTLRFTLQSLATCAVIVYGFGPVRTGPARKLFESLARNKIVQSIGLASYSIYLIHEVLIFAADGSLNDLPIYTTVALNILMSVGAGWAVYLLVERPFEHLRARLR